MHDGAAGAGVEWRQQVAQAPVGELRRDPPDRAATRSSAWYPMMAQQAAVGVGQAQGCGVKTQMASGVDSMIAHAVSP